MTIPSSLAFSGTLIAVCECLSGYTLSRSLLCPRRRCEV